MKAEILICDDDVKQAEALKKLVESYGRDMRIEMFSQGAQMLEYLESHEGRRICLMDVILGQGASGIDLAAKIRQIDPEAIIIFLSGFLEKACDVYEVEHCWFIYKPQKEKKLPEALDKAFSLLERMPRMLVVHKGVNYRKIPVENIFCIERIRRYSLVTCCDGVHDVQETFSELLGMLPESFHQCHRSYIVNFEKVRQFTGSQFELDNGLHVPVSRSFLPALKDAWIRFLMGYRLS